MKRHFLYTIGIGLLLSAMALPVPAQVSNDNEDGVNKVDSRVRFVPGQVLVKFKDESTVQVHRNSKGKFLAASINKVDQLLRSYGVKDMEKLFPAEVAKPKASLRRKAAPNGMIVEEKNLDKVFWIKAQIQGTDSTMQLIKKLQAMPEVEYAEPNYLAYITADVPAGQYEGQSSNSTRAKAPVATETEAEFICLNPSQNPLYDQQYGIPQQNIQALWNKRIKNSKRPVIAILDTGVDINHPDLVDNIWQNTKEVEGETAYDDDNNGLVDDKYGWNFVEDYYDLTDRNGHGTHCAGIAAAADNSIGIVGANPLALIMSVKVMSDRGEGDIATITRGIAYAAKNGADIISMSFGTHSLSNTMKDALDMAYQTAVLVASAGNSGYDIYKPLGTNYPAAYYLVLGVEASDSILGRASFSNYDPDGPIYSEDGIDGRNYEVQVPGVSIYSTLPNGQYNTLSGTSMSAPLLAGAISALQMVKEYPSKDVLYGDLIHLKADFAKIYSDETPRMPKIDLVSMNVDDDVDGNNNIDGQVDVGETILFTPFLRNTWADATDIQLQLTVDPVYASFVDIENPSVPFGQSLSAYGRAEAATPIKVTFANNIGDATRIKFILEVSYHESAESFTQDVYVTVNNMVKISGLVTENRTLTADHIYYVNENLAIPEGVTLTIEPGTRLEFAEGIEMLSEGKLVATGTPELPIVFTGHKDANWQGVLSHGSTGGHLHNNSLYTNADSTLFTILPTELTPNKIENMSFTYYYNEFDPIRESDNFTLVDYCGLTWGGVDMTAYQNLLTDPDFLTPSIINLMTEVKTYLSQFSTTPTESETETGTIYLSLAFPWVICDNPRDTVSYCRLEGFEMKSNDGLCYPYMKDCIITPNASYWDSSVLHYIRGVRNNLTDVSIGHLAYTNGMSYGFGINLWNDLSYSNIINNNFGNASWGQSPSGIIRYSQMRFNNYFNNYYTWANYDRFDGMIYYLGIGSWGSEIDKSNCPSYLGTSLESLVRPYLLEIGNAPTYGQVDLSNMPNRPYSEAHGIVWKVVVNGKDAQDEFEDLAPLGIGRHKFEVYFNRPMNKAVAPQITFGVREPYTQQSVDENGSWNEDGTIYTAYKTISGKTSSDGLNRIYVQGAEDNEFFPCPYEKTRFNIIINAAGSMATGFAAEANMGRVNLTWDNSHNDFDDAMGFNIYRYNEEQRLMPVYDEWGNEIWEDDGNGNSVRREEMQTVRDTICLNTEIVDIETTEFTDYDVTPGETYYYYYKVLSTDLKEYDVSNVVAATPLTSRKGDANGDNSVSVPDVISTVNYILGESPKPFIFEAADMNSDLDIDVLDVIGIIQAILNQPAGARANIESLAQAVYTIEDGVLFIETPVALSGLQIQISTEGTPKTTETLKGFEVASCWLTENDYRMLAYSFGSKTLAPGKHAIMTIGSADITSLRLADTAGNNVLTVPGEATLIKDAMGSKVMTTKGVYNLSGQKMSGKDTNLRKGIYIINGEKVVK